ARPTENSPAWALAPQKLRSLAHSGRPGAIVASQSLMQDGIDKPPGSRLLQRPNLTAQYRPRTLGLRGLHNTEAAEQRNERGVDPYPFTLLNLLLSCLAASQAPIIVMSQNRGESRDRLRAENDYKVNLKAELEIRHLHEKIDHLLSRQYNRLFEIQQIQIEL